MKYKVHRYYLVRDVVKVEADSQLAAIKKADDEARVMREAEDDEGPTQHFLVDVEGDDEYIHSRWYRLTKSASDLCPPTRGEFTRRKNHEELDCNRPG